jgi:hypothetical protein
MPAVFTGNDIRLWFRERYPKVKYGTVQAHLAAAVVNSPSHDSYKMKVGDLIFRRSDGRFEKYDPAVHGVPGSFPKAAKGGTEAIIVRQNPGRTTDMRGTRHAARNAQIAQRVAAGERVEDVAESYGLSPAYVGHLLRTFTFEIRPTGGGDEDEAEGDDLGDLDDARPPELGSRPWELIGEFLGTNVGPGVLSLKNGLTQRYELISADERIVGSLLQLGNAVQPSRWPLISEHVWLLQQLGPHVRKVLVISGDERTPRVWLDNLGRLAEDVEFLVLRDGKVIDLRGSG